MLGTKSPIEPGAPPDPGGILAFWSILSLRPAPLVSFVVRPQADTRSQDLTPGDELLPVAGVRAPRSIPRTTGWNTCEGSTSYELPVSAEYSDRVLSCAPAR